MIRRSDRSGGWWLSTMKCTGHFFGEFVLAVIETFSSPSSDRRRIKFEPRLPEMRNGWSSKLNNLKLYTP